MSKEGDGDSGRLTELEGLRGLAAVAVVIFHSLVIFYPVMFYGVISGWSPVQHLRIEDNLFGNPLMFFASGAFAVAIFFVLSGFVLSYGFFSTKKESVVRRIAAKRYLRLMLPALVSVILAWSMMSLGLTDGKTHADVITQAGPSSSLWGFLPNIFTAMSQGVWGVFSSVISTGLYNPVLWTMLYEFWGSFAVFAVILLFGGAKHRWIIYCLLALASFNTWYLGFLTGMVLADLYANRQQIFSSLRSKRIAWTLLITGLFLGGYPASFAANSVYKLLKLSNVSYSVDLSIYMTLGATMVVYAVLTIPLIKNALRRKRLCILGKYTFSMYLIHLPILFTLGLGIFAKIEPFLGYNKSVIVSLLISLPVVALATWLFERYIDAPSIRLASRVAKIFEG